jgi:hypothetical protein
MKDCDAAVHSGGPIVRGRENCSLEAYCDVMVKGTWNVAQACATQKCSGWSTFPPSSRTVGHRHKVRVSREREGGSSAKVDLFYSLAKIWAKLSATHTTRHTGWT